MRHFPWQQAARDNVVIAMAVLRIIRRWRLREDLSIRENALRTGQTAKQLHEDLVKLGYTGSYGRVAACEQPISAASANIG